MPWKFIIFIIICIVFSLFVGFNLGNQSDISFIFVTLQAVPVYLVVLLSFAAGASIGILASVFTKSKKKKQKKEKIEKKSTQQETAGEPPAAEEKRRGRKKK